MRGLSVEFRRIQSMSSKGNQRLRIDAEGDLYADLIATDLPPGQDWPDAWPECPLRRLSEAELQTLRRLIVDVGFAQLPASLIRAGRDGFRDELDVMIDGRPHSVVVERTEPPEPFIRVRNALWKLAGPPYWP